MKRPVSNEQRPSYCPESEVAKLFVKRMELNPDIGEIDMCPVQPATCCIAEQKKNTRLLKSRCSILIGSGGRIRTCDLWVMSPTSYRAAPPRDCRAIIVVFPVMSILKVVLKGNPVGISEVGRGFPGVIGTE